MLISLSLSLSLSLQHLCSARHREYATNEDNFKSLDKLISQGKSFSQFICELRSTPPHSTWSVLTLLIVLPPSSPPPYYNLYSLLPLSLQQFTVTTDLHTSALPLSHCVLSTRQCGPRYPADLTCHTHQTEISPQAPHHPSQRAPVTHSQEALHHTGQITTH